MPYSWTSNTRSAQPLYELCTADLVSVTITRVVGSVITERIDAAGYLPHVVYKPKFNGRDNDRGCGGIGGDVVPDTTPLEFRVNIEPFWVPYPGQLFLDGGGGGVPYVVTIQKSRKQPKPIEEPTILIVAGSVPTQIPRGAHQVKTPGATYDALSEKSVTFTLAGLALPFSVTDQWLPIGSLAQGTVTGPVAGLPILFRVRI